MLAFTSRPFKVFMQRSDEEGRPKRVELTPKLLLIELVILVDKKKLMNYPFLARKTTTFIPVNFNVILVVQTIFSSYGVEELEEFNEI